MKPLIETPRLVLRQIVPSDKDDMYALHADPAVQQYTGEPLIKSVAEMEEAIQYRLDNYDKYGYGRWATLRKSDGQFIGWAGLAYLEEFGETDLGYRFMPNYWGSGYATEASEAILRYGFDVIRLKRIIAIAMKDNLASIRVMQKIGMQFEKYAPYEPGGEDVAWYWCDKSMLVEK